MPKAKVLIFIPTYNEKDNIGPLFERIQKLNLSADILFLDDNSPDGTGHLMDEIAKSHPHVHVIHRTGKLGIGSAHKEAIRWAYQRGYQTLVTMDADFTHSPESIPAFLERGETTDIVVATRYAMKESLAGWNLFRKFLTRLGHILTSTLLGLKYDATGAFRVYRMTVINRHYFESVKSDGYSFFFESLYRLDRAKYSIAEIPISLPPRTYGSSKMSYFEVLKSVKNLFALCWLRLSTKFSLAFTPTGEVKLDANKST